MTQNDGISPCILCPLVVLKLGLVVTINTYYFWRGGGEGGDTHTHTHQGIKISE